MYSLAYCVNRAAIYDPLHTLHEQKIVAFSFRGFAIATRKYASHIIIGASLLRLALHNDFFFVMWMATIAFRIDVGYQLS